MTEAPCDGGRFAPDSEQIRIRRSLAINRVLDRLGIGIQVRLADARRIRQAFPGLRIRQIDAVSEYCRQVGVQMLVNGSRG